MLDALQLTEVQREALRAKFKPTASPIAAPPPVPVKGEVLRTPPPIMRMNTGESEVCQPVRGWRAARQACSLLWVCSAQLLVAKAQPETCTV